jgi:hypothetical protein
MTAQPSYQKNLAVAAIIGGLMVLVIAFTASPAGAQSASEDSGTPVERSRESLKTYSKPITIHSVSFEDVQKMNDESKSSRYDAMIPDVPSSYDDSAPSQGFQQPLKAPARSPKSDDEMPDEEDEQDKKSGWGWLADDINKTRKSKDETTRHDDRTDTGESDTGKPSDEDSSLTNGKKKTDENKYFMDSSFNTESRENSILRPLREDKKSETEKSRDRMSDNNEQDENNPDQATSVEASDVDDSASRSPGLAMRDPFAPPDKKEEAKFGERNWNQSGSGDSIFSSREAYRAATEFDRDGAGDIVSGGFRSDNQLERLVGDAASDSTRMSSAWTGYSSDSIFNAGGGYTPSSVGSAGSDSLFSGAGVFGGNSAASFVTPAQSSLGTFSPAENSAFGFPSSSSLGSERIGTDSVTPSALPW